MNPGLESLVRGWLQARDPGDAPASLRSAAARVPDSVRPMTLPALGAALDRLPGVWGTRRSVVIAALIILLLAAVALVGAGALLRALDATPRFPPRGLIAYAAPDGNLWVVAADGSGARAITTTPEAEFDPRWSPDGRTLLFTRAWGSNAAPDACASFTNSSLVILDLATSAERVLLTRQGFVYAPGWSADGTRIAFLEPAVACKVPELPRSAGGGVVDVASGVVSSVPAGSGSSWLSWTGTSIAFVWGDHIAFADTAASGTGPALQGILNFGGLGWAVPSPDGQRAALAKGVHDVTGHVVVEDRPTGRRVDLGIGGAAVWSPDGRSIAFVGPATSGGPDGTRGLVVTKAPDWQTRTVATILVVPSQQGGQLVANAPDLAWSSDGRSIYWLDLGKGHIVNVATGQTVDLPANLQGCTDLQWQPVP